MTAVAAALYLAERGWHVFPCAPRGKTPVTRNGCLDATTDPATIRGWWERWPDANLACATGEVSGIVVVDVDDGAAIADLEARGLPRTCTSQTGSGGFHFVYRHPGGVRLPNTAKRIHPGVDTRGDGGYVVLPPSVHPNGEPYVWLQRMPPAAPPGWLIDALTADPTSDPSGPVELVDGAATRWGRRILEEELQAVAAATPGTRNDTLNRSAYAVFGAVKGGQLDRREAWEALEAAGTSAGLPVAEVRRTIASAWSGADPRRPQDRPPLSPSAPTGGGGPSDVPLPPDPDTPPAEDVAPWRIYTDDELDDIPPPEWLIDGYVAAGLVTLYGPSKAGKSFLAIDWALSVASGRRWLDGDVRRSPVLYVAAEGAPGLSQRRRAWKFGRQTTASGFHVVASRVNLLDPVHVEHLSRAVATRGVRLLVIDTVARCMPGGDENSAKDVGMVIDGLERIRERHGCAVVVVHHTGVEGVRPRGSTALFGACDTVVRVDPVGDDMSGRMEVRCDKQKDALEFRRFGLRMRAIGDSCILEPDTETAAPSRAFVS